MKLLADANVEAAIVDWLRLTGHDVIWAAEFTQRLDDPELLAAAKVQERIVLTHDLDFGEMIFRSGLPCEGVILMRFSAAVQVERLATLQRLWDTFSAQATGRFILVSDHRTRIRPLPAPR